MSICYFDGATLLCRYLDAPTPESLSAFLGLEYYFFQFHSDKRTSPEPEFVSFACPIGVVVLKFAPAFLEFWTGIPPGSVFCLPQACPRFVRSDQHTNRLGLCAAVSQRLLALGQAPPPSVYPTVLQALIPAPDAALQLLHFLALSIRVVCWHAERAAVVKAEDRRRGLYNRARMDRLFVEDGVRRTCLICGEVCAHPGRYLAHLEERHGGTVEPLDDSVF
jgi:hypothetical protein